MLRRNGFSLVELLVVVAIVALLAALALFAGAFTLYHVISFRARRAAVPDAPTLAELLLYEKAQLDRRISTLSSLVWRYVLPALTGLYLIILPAAEDAAARALIPLAFIVGGTGLHLYLKRTVRKDYLPLRAAIDDRLRALNAER